MSEPRPAVRRRAPYRVVRDKNSPSRPWLAMHRQHGNVYRPLGWVTTWRQALDIVATHARDTGRH